MSRDAELGEPGAVVRGYDPAAYGDRLASDYDRLYPSGGLETDAAADFLARLASRYCNPSVLEFGIGTGRLAIALNQRGLPVAGIEASTKMLAVLREKTPTASIDVAVGDYASTRLADHFSVVTLVFNNIFDPRGLSAQLAIFENAARHLTPGGSFVVEAFVLSDDARDGTWKVSSRYVGTDHAELQMARFDIATSTLERTLVHLRPDGTQFVSVRDAYAGPGELDVMAHVNGLERAERYSSWQRDAFTAQSRRHITVYQLR